MAMQEMQTIRSRIRARFSPTEEKAYFVAIGGGGTIWYMESTADNWTQIPGLAQEGTLVAMLKGITLHITCRGTDGKTYYGTIDTTTGEFSGFKPLPGSTTQLLMV